MDDSAAGSSISSSNSMPSSSSSLSSSPLGSDNEAEEHSLRKPLLPLLASTLLQLRRKETFADALKRLASGEASAFAELTSLHGALMSNHELVLMSTTREDILLMALAEANRLQVPLPPAWMLRWRAKPQTDHGPFSNETVERWRTDGFFLKKDADLCNINAVKPQWISAVDAWKAEPFHGASPA